MRIEPSSGDSLSGFDCTIALFLPSRCHAKRQSPVAAEKLLCSISSVKAVTVDPFILIMAFVIATLWFVVYIDDIYGTR